MDRITIFGDIHGNWPALQAVWGDMDRRELENRYCLGDLVGYGVFPNEVVNHIRDHNVPTIVGNYDDGVGRSSDDCGCMYKKPEEEALGKRSIAWSNAHTTDENKRFLREELHAQLPVQLGNFKVMLVHGSPRRVNEYLYEDRPDKSLERLLDMVEADVLVCGHTHIPYHRVLPSGRHVINAGSVGKPKDGYPAAGYIVLRANGELEVDFIRVPYDVEGIAQAIEASAMPSEYATLLRLGKG